MTIRVLMLVVGGMLAGVISGCASTMSAEPDQESPGRKAAELNTQLGREYMSRGQYEVALEKLKKAVASDPGYAPGHTVLAVLYETLGEDAAARRHFEEAVEAAPDNGDVNNNMGAYLCRTGKDKRANRYFERALEDPFYRTPAVAMTNAGSCALQRGDTADADRYLRLALEYDPQFSDALLNLAALNLEQQQFLRARAFLQRYEVSGEITAGSLLLGYQVERSLNNEREAGRYRAAILQRFPGTPEAAELQTMGTL